MLILILYRGHFLKLIGTIGVVTQPRTKVEKRAKILILGDLQNQIYYAASQLLLVF